MQGHLKEKGQTVPDDYFDRMSDIPLVEITSLLPCNKETGMIAINMYSDDKSISKGLLVNKRATDIAHYSGNYTQIRGDVFIAKIHDDEMGDIFTRIDFTTADLSSDAPWFTLARKINDKKNDSKSTSAPSSSTSNAVISSVITCGGYYTYILLS